MSTLLIHWRREAEQLRTEVSRLAGAGPVECLLSDAAEVEARIDAAEAAQPEPTKEGAA